MTEPTPRGRQFGCLFLLGCMALAAAAIVYFASKGLTP